MLGVVGQKLYASLGHRTGGDASDRKASLLLALIGCDRSAHVDERQHREPCGSQPIMLGCCIGAAERCEMQPDMMRQTLVQLPRQRRIGDGGEDFDIATAEHCATVAGTRRDRLAIDPVGLGGERGQAEAALLQGCSRRVHIRHEVGDMVQKHCAGLGQLTNHRRVPPCALHPGIKPSFKDFAKLAEAASRPLFFDDALPKLSGRGALREHNRFRLNICFNDSSDLAWR